jgi:hypothetical protein
MSFELCWLIISDASFCRLIDLITLICWRVLCTEIIAQLAAHGDNNDMLSLSNLISSLLSLLCAEIFILIIFKTKLIQFPHLPRLRSQFLRRPPEATVKVNSCSHAGLT